MSLVVPDVLQEVRQLPSSLLGVGLLIGALLWVMGAASHRFWLVLSLTLGAGLHGLMYGKAYGMQPLVAGLLLAVATGALALSLVRVLVFAAGGIAALALARALSFALDEPLVCLLIGGLVGIVFYRLWITLLCSLVGTLFLAYCGLGLADRLFKVDAMLLALEHPTWLNSGLAAGTLAGVVVQYLLDRHRARRRQKRADKAEQERRILEERARRSLPSRPVPWWAWIGRSKQRRAG
jgi:hypothetical protein